MSRTTPNVKKMAQIAQAEALEAQLTHDEKMAEFRLRLQTAMPAFVAAWDQMASIIGEHMKYQGFDAQKVFAADIALMHSELSESLEADRKDALDDKLIAYEGRAVELADTVIRILHAQAKYRLDSIGSLTVQKAAFNTTRPYKHGKEY